MLGKKFQHTKEDFVCEHCGAVVVGNGYTNHCPECLWSKHVDINPGDRAATCGGLMEPLSLEGSTPSYRVVQRCVRCGYEKRNTLSKIDNPKSVVMVAQKAARVL
jgi:rubredoxin